MSEVNLVNNRLESYANITVYEGKENEQKIPLETRVRDALSSSWAYADKGLDEVEEIARNIVDIVNVYEEKTKNDVIGLSINDDGSLAVLLEGEEKPFIVQPKNLRKSKNDITVELRKALTKQSKFVTDVPLSKYLEEPIENLINQNPAD
ncbi:MAG: hypothetical protein LBD99_07565 [Candidatus Margulisbacteria bacterium]|jgi:hypothetical protein|nr:hypothetical protein [Candidatus Margulisiibacteriota bacterium]